ncbi:MAG: hypothetical protein FJX72_21750 [Armatimonadetes bacterium]|nr:hypothetical protein [Armatimonadota bacterium]
MPLPPANHTMQRTLTNIAAASRSPRSTRIAVISDLHIVVGDGPEQVAKRAHLSTALSDIRATAPDLVLVPGDMSENGLAAELEAFLGVVADLPMPVRWTPGNHDIGDKWIDGRPGVTSERAAAYESVAGPSRYAEDVAGIRLVVLNGPIMGSGLPEEADQWEWLEAQPRPATGTPGVLMLHYPSYLDREDEPAGDYWTLERTPRARLLALAERDGYAAIVAGHLHRPIQTRHRGVSLLTAPSIAFGLPIVSQSVGWMLVEIGPDGAARAEIRYVAGPEVTSPQASPS